MSSFVHARIPKLARSDIAHTRSRSSRRRVHWIVLLTAVTFTTGAEATRLVGLSSQTAPDALSTAAACSALEATARTCRTDDLASLRYVAGLPSGPWAATINSVPIGTAGQAASPIPMDALGLAGAGPLGSACAQVRRLADNTFRVAIAVCAEQPALCCADLIEPLFSDDFEEVR